MNDVYEQIATAKELLTQAREELAAQRVRLEYIRKQLRFLTVITPIIFALLGGIASIFLHRVFL